MSTHGQLAVVQSIYRADEQREPAALFALVPEGAVWQHAQAIIDDSEQGYLAGPILLRAIRDAFASIQDHVSARDVLLHALDPALDSLVFNAAQKAVLGLAPNWHADSTRLFHDRFEQGYRGGLANGDPFIAALALEGVVMLPIYRGDERLLIKSIGLLLNDFPSVPNDPEDAALLPVKALKLLGQCYDVRPQDTVLAEAIEDYVGVRNIAVDSEARFNLGLVWFYRAFQSSDQVELQSSLRIACDRFEQSMAGEESRTDAYLFLAIGQCYLQLLASPNPAESTAAVRTARSVLTERLLSFGGAASPDRMVVEFHLVQLITQLDRWSEQLATATEWPDIKPPMEMLANVYDAVRRLQAFEGLVGDTSKITYDLVMLPQMFSQFIQVQEIVAKLQSVLSNTGWREATPASEIAFYELVLQEVQGDVYPKDKAAAKLDKIVAAAEREAPILASTIIELRAQGLNTTDTLLEAAWQSIKAIQDATQPRAVSGPELDIYEKVLPCLRDALGWKPASQRWVYLSHAIQLIAHHFHLLFCATGGKNMKPDQSFLFAKQSSTTGLGDDATEAHLRDHFYNRMQWVGGVNVFKERGDYIPGRPDLRLGYPEGVDFPIEVKCEGTDISCENIRESYVAQAQSYVAGACQVGFLFILDVTTKNLGTPLRHEADYWHIDRRDVPGAKNPDWVIVVVYPANRPHYPSDHSWRRKRSAR